MSANTQNAELPEFSMRGPFGGVQSELPLEAIENYGFSDAVNMVFRQGRVHNRPLLNTLALMPSTQETWTGIADFFASNGNRLQVGFTPTRLLNYTGGAWSSIYGSFTGSSSNIFRTAVVGQKLCFSQGVDVTAYWDGIAGTITTPAGTGAVPAKYMAEVANHLVVANTIEGGSQAYQRVRWTGAGDPTDWTSYNAGAGDLFNDLGPISGVLKLYQYGYIFQQRGIVQMIPTGIGTQPFDFVPLSAASKGLTCPYSLASFGENLCAYVGKDNVYTFDGTASTPIGDSPIDGRRRLGARSRIFADLMKASPTTVLGFISSSINGIPFFAYWLVIPNVSVWVYNFDEGNWTRWTFANTINVIGSFTTNAAIRIMDLTGTISQQAWTPATLTNNNPFDGVFLGMKSGTPGYIDWTGVCEQPASLTTGQLAFGDLRHEKQTVKLRVITQDSGQSRSTFTLTNEKSQAWSKTSVVGNGSGASLTNVYTPNVAGKYVTLGVTVPANVPFSCSELTLVYNTSGEVR
jgi:hypothetical protein